MTDPVNQTKINVRVQPNARCDEVLGFTDDVLKIRITAPPVTGKANKKLVEVLSECLGINKSRLSILKGETGRNKVIIIEGLGREEVLKRLSSL
jgi:uncharacterized protein (TIGR00251 family)